MRPLRFALARTLQRFSLPPPTPSIAWMAPALVRDLLFSCHRPCCFEHRPPAAVGLGPSRYLGVDSVRLHMPDTTVHSRGRTRLGQHMGADTRVGLGKLGGLCGLSTSAALSRVVYISRRERPDEEPSLPPPCAV